MTAELRAVEAGAERAFALHGQPVLRDDGAVIAAVFVARELPDEAQLPTNTAAELALLHLFTSDDPLEEVVVQALAFLGETEGWDAGIVWARNDDDVLQPAAIWLGALPSQEKIRPRIEAMRFERGRGVPGKAWAAGEPVWIADVLDESAKTRAEIAAAAGLHSVVAIPIVDRGNVVGVLELFTQAVRALSERTVRSLVRIGEAMGRLLERRRLLELIEGKGREWTLTFDSIELPIFLVSANGKILRVNSAARDLAGRSYDELIGQPLRGEGEPWTTLADLVDGVIEGGCAGSAQLVTDRSWDLVGGFIPPADSSEEPRAIVVMRDVTQLVELQEAVRRGEQLAALGELVAGVAHEVKNPVFGMGMTLDLLEEQLGEDAEAAELLGALRKWVNRLNKLMENLLDYGKPWRLDLRPGRIDAIVHAAIEGCAPRALEHNVAIDHRARGERIALLDATRLTQAFENLITNAIQHSPAGSTVTIMLVDGGDKVTYEIADSGRGFEPSDLPRVFQPFFTRRRGGTGLGLAIVQRILEEHGGTVNAGNQEKGGAVVRVCLPLYRAPTPSS